MEHSTTPENLTYCLQLLIEIKGQSAIWEWLHDAHFAFEPWTDGKESEDWEEEQLLSNLHICVARFGIISLTEKLLLDQKEIERFANAWLIGDYDEKQIKSLIAQSPSVNDIFQRKPILGELSKVYSYIPEYLIFEVKKCQKDLCDLENKIAETQLQEFPRLYNHLLESLEALLKIVIIFGSPQNSVKIEKGKKGDRIE